MSPWSFQAGLSYSVFPWLPQVCLWWKLGVSKSFFPARWGVSEGHRVCVREACVLRLAQGGTSCSPPTLRGSSPAETDERVGRATLHEVKTSQDPQPSPVVGAATLLRDLLQPSSFRNDLIWVDTMLSSVQRACFHHALQIWPHSVRDTMFCINASWKLQAENWPRRPI